MNLILIFLFLLYFFDSTFAQRFSSRGWGSFGGTARRSSNPFVGALGRDTTRYEARMGSRKPDSLLGRSRIPNRFERGMEHKPDLFGGMMGGKINDVRGSYTPHTEKEFSFGNDWREDIARLEERLARLEGEVRQHNQAGRFRDTPSSRGQMMRNPIMGENFGSMRNMGNDRFGQGTRSQQSARGMPTHGQMGRPGSLPHPPMQIRPPSHQIASRRATGASSKDPRSKQGGMGNPPSGGGHSSGRSSSSMMPQRKIPDTDEMQFARSMKTK